MLKNLCNPDGSCSHRCTQGKDCEGSRTATCLAVGMPFLIPCDGGARVSGDDSQHLQAQPALAPRKSFGAFLRNLFHL